MTDENDLFQTAYARLTNDELFQAAYARWRDLPYRVVLEEMALLFHLALQIEKVRELEREKGTHPYWKEYWK